MSLQRVASATADLPLFDLAATRAIEAQALGATPPHALMQRAGDAVARLALAVAPHAQRITIAAGPGNNGGDGLVAAMRLAEAGKRARIVHLADTHRLPADAADACARLHASGLKTVQGPLLCGDEDLVIDALLGIGTRRAPEGPVADAVAQLAHSAAPVLAVDLPSSLHPDTGQCVGDQAVRARWTLSLLTLKPGLFTGAGRDHCGDVWLADLDVAADAAPSAWLGAPAAMPAGGLPDRRHVQHKGSFGDVVLVGGAGGMEGAIRLAGRAALAAGAGRVYLSPLAQDGAADPGRPELMQRAQAWRSEPGLLQGATVLCGCGGGDEVASTLPPLLRHAGRLILDADALNAVARDSALHPLLAARGARGRPTVLTPHPLEAARLLGSSAAAVQADRIAAARELAARFAAIVVLKGSGTVIAGPGQAPWINPTGNALLATPGSGDVLAGWIAGRCAQGDARQFDGAIRAAVWLHGRAADQATRRCGPSLPLLAAELVDAMRAAAA